MPVSWGDGVVVLIGVGGVGCSSCTLRLLIVSIAPSAGGGWGCIMMCF